MATTMEPSIVSRPATMEEPEGLQPVGSGTNLPRSGTIPRPAGATSEFPTNTNPILPTRGSQVSVLVTGATGTAGYEVVKHLCSPELRNRFKLVAAVHRDHPGLDALDDCDVIRHIDADDLGRLQFSGIDLLLIIPSNSENRVEQVRNYVAAAVRDGVKFILLLSLVQPLTDRGKSSVFARQFKEMENIVSGCGIPCAYLRCTFFMQTLLAHADEIANHSTISLPIGRGSCAPLNVVDAARASCAILMDPATHAYKAYDLSGPEILSGVEIAQAVSRALGRRIEFRDCSPEEFIDLYRSHGVPEWLARGFFEILDLHASGNMSTGEAKSFYTDLTGYHPIVLEQFFADYDELFLNPHSDIDPLTAAKSYRRSTYRESPQRRGRFYGRESEYRSHMNTSEELYMILRELVEAKENSLRVKYSQLRQEEDLMDRLVSAFQLLESPGPMYSYRRSRMGRGGRHRRPPPEYLYGDDDSDMNYEGPWETHRYRGGGGRREGRYYSPRTAYY